MISRSMIFIIGIILVVIGVGLFAYYENYVKPERESKELLTEAKLIFERGDKDSVNHAINTLNKVIAKYPKSKAIPDAYYYIGRCYEKLGLNRLAYLKYNYLLKNRAGTLTKQFKKEILVRLAHLNIIKQYSEEGINQLHDLLNESFNKDFRSKVYSELGHTYLNLGKYTEAKKMFDISLNENGSNEDAILGKARAIKRMGHDNKAYDLYEHFLKYYGPISQYTKDVKRSYKEQAYKSGLNAFRTARYYDAISFFNRVLKNFSYDKKSENAFYWIGECYFALKKFDKAITYFNRALTNNFYHKDHDAQLKKGFAYFMSKRFDLAAKEFQIYLNNYPNGKYAPRARDWKKQSTEELILRIDRKKLPKVQETPETEEIPENNAAPEEESISHEKDEEVSGDNRYLLLERGGKIKLENVAEL
ncbi:MAG: tetratricopeptide repeat protein [Spirochaetota bacterium]|nr:tetratricopeptide repeat protein [Spirochaetota bacterium]